MNRLFLCTDLDRTLLPNGPQPESNQARVLFSQLVAFPQVTLVYVTGRHQQLVKQAMEEYQLPQADFVIADVGSMIYKITADEWLYQQDWDEIIKHDWKDKSHDEINALFSEVKDIQLQEASKQNTYKLSYYVPFDSDYQRIISTMKQILQQHSIAGNLIWSVVSHANIGLLDVLPASAGKQQAIEFLMQQLGFDYSETVFAGDSGNDICVMSSPIQSVLVANADEDVRAGAIRQAKLNDQIDTLYLARGDFMNMNGNYSAGILEGVAHFIPQVEDWLRGKP